MDAPIRKFNLMRNADGEYRDPRGKPKPLDTRIIRKVVMLDAAANNEGEAAVHGIGVRRPFGDAVLYHIEGL